MKPSVDAIIINRNSGDLLRDCLTSMEKTVGDASFDLTKVIVIDDMSIDDSVVGLERFQLPIVLVRNSARSGYGASCNKAVELSSAKYLLFVNTDAILYNDSIRAPIEFMESPDAMNVAVCGIQLLDADGRVSRKCAHFPAAATFLAKSFGLSHLSPSRFPGIAMTNWDHSFSREVDHVIGAVTVMRREIFVSLKGYDPRFFVYLEDLDLSLRIKEAGYSTYYLATARAMHQGGGTARKAWAESIFFSLRSRIIYSYKHFAWPSAALIMVTTLCLEPMMRLALAVLKRSGNDLSATVKSTYYLWRDLPNYAKYVFEALLPNMPRSMT